MIVRIPAAIAVTKSRAQSIIILQTTTAHDYAANVDLAAEAFVATLLQSSSTPFVDKVADLLQTFKRLSTDRRFRDYSDLADKLDPSLNQFKVGDSDA